MTNARALSDNLAALLRREHEAMADFLVALADFDRRRSWGELGYASLFQFLHRELHHDLEFHHVTARAIGGKAVIVEDVKVACREHNDVAARQDFGNTVMDRYTGPKRKRRSRRS